MSDTLFVKGDRSRIVSTPAEQVAAEWEGFKPAPTAVEELDRSTLQAQAKELGIKANQSTEALREAISGFTPSDETEGNDNPDAPETDEDSPVTDPS